ncbi:SRPBCC family protein [Stackebrandtia nassauensis]|uniref:Cyclase/dehydrase n=1 Tax=Stackebrandtia nassauensis (strain DSM 44728 / CIP 108903 / NRRL B-16338 / NBRC 102104 / LLR-40K-21) TaxID=446470 RepID=D3Q8A3_STANL|nr:SRPBCC family protein [Stackebrandtia nassauensis]ADD42477.1 cyclase/dehydrase [Stackebrandtia nassauensis DSM 44728]
MSNIVESITVNVPASDAYGQWSKFDELPKFMSGVSRVDLGPNGLTHWVIDIGGVTREFDAKVLTAETDRRVAWTSVEGPRHSGSVEFAPINESSTRVTAQLDVDPEGFVESAADKLGVLNLRLKKDLASFKNYMEDPANPHGERH